jgi:hypothetical protein
MNEKQAALFSQKYRQGKLFTSSNKTGDSIQFLYYNKYSVTNSIDLCSHPDPQQVLESQVAICMHYKGMIYTHRFGSTSPSAVGSTMGRT